MYEHWAANIWVVLATFLAVGACVLIHYEGLNLVSRALARRHDSERRRKVLYGILGVLILHIVEIWLFGLTFYGLLLLPDTGAVTGAHPLALFDAVYLASMCYTTVGFGDVSPVGPIRFLAGTSALTGFVMITWSASFTFLEMERFWRR
ncbi:MAG: ion channel [Arenimonas sp.]|nr:ion channel [Arenimonas sp.]